jgi:hypothetical protein
MAATRGMGHSERHVDEWLHRQADAVQGIVADDADDAADDE